MTEIVMTEEEKKADKVCEEHNGKSRLFHEKYEKVIDDILRELSTLSPEGYARRSEHGDLIFYPNSHGKIQTQ